MTTMNSRPMARGPAPPQQRPKLGRVDVSTPMAPRIILNAVEGWGKCLAKDTPVLRFNGEVVKVQDIREGDLLMGPDSKPRKVWGLHHGFGPLFRITPTKGEPYVVNHRHILSLKMSRHLPGPRQHRIVNLPVTDYLEKTHCFKRDAMGWHAAVTWPETKQPISPYLLGCWLGDGSSSSAAITTADACVLSEMREYAEAHGIRVRIAAEAGAATTYRISGPRSGGTRSPNPFMQSLIGLGVLNNKHVPLTYKAASRVQRLELLAGLLDTDGHLYGNCFDIVQKSESLARDIVFVARSLGLGASIAACEKTCNNSLTQARGHYFRVKISGDTDAIPTRILRKRATPRSQIKDPTVTGISVDPSGVGEFFGFEVDEDHLFLLGDCTVTHNTSYGAHAPNAVVLMSRGETGYPTLRQKGLVPDLDCVELTRWKDVLDQIDELATAGNYGALVLDAMGGFERLCHEYICTRDFEGNWGEKGFGSFQKGYDVSVAEWLQLLQRLDRVRVARNIPIILLSHSRIRPFKNPLGSDFDRYIADCHEKTWGLSHKWADAVFFGTYVTVTVEDKKNKRTKGIGGDERVLYTTRRDAYDAKNRYAMPPQLTIPDDPSQVWPTVWAAIASAPATAAIEDAPPAL